MAHSNRYRARGPCQNRFSREGTQSPPDRARDRTCERDHFARSTVSVTSRIAVKANMICDKDPTTAQLRT